MLLAQGVEVGRRHVDQDPADACLHRVARDALEAVASRRSDDERRRPRRCVRVDVLEELLDLHDRVALREVDLDFEAEPAAGLARVLRLDLLKFLVFVQQSDDDFRHQAPEAPSCDISLARVYANSNLARSGPNIPLTITTP